MTKKVVIVGGVAGGASAAARLRRLDESIEIIILERTKYISYANCGLPYYIGDVIKDKNDLTLQTKESFKERFNIDVRVENEVIEIKAEDKIVVVKDLSDGHIYEESYDDLILSLGAKSTKPNMKGIDNNKIFTLRTVEDTLYLKDYINKNDVKDVNIIGGGFIGVEMAENLRHLGLNVRLIEFAKHILGPLDDDMASIAQNKMRSEGIELNLETAVESFEDKANKILTITNKGEFISDLVVLAIGVTPDTKIAIDAGIKCGIKGAIITNDKMETSIKHIYAIGDAIEVDNFVTKQRALISLAGPANKQGRIVADNIMGLNKTYKGSQGSSILKLFDLAIATTGINETLAIRENIDYEKIILSPLNHASYYPNAKAMLIKALFEKGTNRILGAQIIGYDGVDKRIDVLATAIRANLSILDLTELELAYAPPFGSAKDPINMLGFIAENVINEKMLQYHYHDLDRLVKEDVILLDTRTKYEYDKGHIEGYINIPLDELRDNLDKLDKSKEVYVMCQTGLRSYLASRILMNNGFKAYNLSGGYSFVSMIYQNNCYQNQKTLCGL